jgi:hypothetical protein
LRFRLKDLFLLLLANFLGRALILHFTGYLIGGIRLLFLRVGPLSFDQSFLFLVLGVFVSLLDDFFLSLGSGRFHLLLGACHHPLGLGFLAERPLLLLGDLVVIC